MSSDSDVDRRVAIVSLFLNEYTKRSFTGPI